MEFMVYVHTSPNGKRYVGQTCCEKLEYRCGKNGSQYSGNAHFASAIKKYGWDNFKHEVVADNLTQEEANRLEKDLILKFNSTDPDFGYNYESGGRTGPIANFSTRQKISDAMKGRKLSDSVRSAISERMKGNNNFRGKTHSEESRKKIGLAHKGKITLSKPVLCIETNQIFASAKFAAEFLGDVKYRSAISACCLGEQKTSHGHRWKYYEG